MMKIDKNKRTATTEDTEKDKKTQRKSEISQEEFENLKNQLARALADYDNLRKRVEKEKEVWMRVATEIVVAKLLPTLDTLETAQTHLNDQGLAMAIGQFRDVLKEERLEEVKPAVGDEFNAEVHEAIESIPGGEKGKIAELSMSGWRFAEGPVVRFAKVKVYGERLSEKKKSNIE